MLTRDLLARSRSSLDRVAASGDQPPAQQEWSLVGTDIQADFVTFDAQSATCESRKSACSAGTAQLRIHVRGAVAES